MNGIASWGNALWEFVPQLKNEFYCSSFQLWWRRLGTCGSEQRSTSTSQRTECLDDHHCSQLYVLYASEVDRAIWLFCIWFVQLCITHVIDHMKRVPTVPATHHRHRISKQKHQHNHKVIDRSSTQWQSFGINQTQPPRQFKCFSASLFQYIDIANLTRWCIQKHHWYKISHSFSVMLAALNAQQSTHLIWLHSCIANYIILYVSVSIESRIGIREDKNENTINR